MKKTFKNSRSILTFILLVSFLLNFPMTNKVLAQENRKAIVFVIDEVSLDEILNTDTPNFDRLIDEGAIGMMNTRGKSSVNNKGSAYLSLGMGVRTLASTKGDLAFERQELYSPTENPSLDRGFKAQDLYRLYTGVSPAKGDILNIAIEDIRRTTSKVTPNNKLGLLGQLARDNNISIGVLGNRDSSSPKREFTMMAIDENGIIPYGYVSEELLKADPNSLSGLSLDHEIMLDKFNSLKNKADLIFIDYGDTVRAQQYTRLATDSIREIQKIKTIKEADKFLGQVIDSVDLDKTMLMVISPNPSKNMVDQGNFGLTPIILKSPDLDKGLLSSTTTNRKGLVTNFDFGPSLLHFLGLEKTNDFIGTSIQSVKTDDARSYILNLQDQSLYLRSYRKFFHWTFIGLILVCLLAYYLPIVNRKLGRKKDHVKYLVYTILALPLTMMTVSIFGYSFIVLDLAYVFILAFILGFVLDKLFKNEFKTISFIAFLNTGLLLLDVFKIKNLMIISPLGSDAIAGGRFYGIGNDYMGILLGSIIIGLFSFYEYRRPKKLTMALVTTALLGLATVALSPIFGANMGGTLSSMAVILVSLLVIFDKKLSFKKLIILAIVVSIFIIAVASLDFLFNPNPTHAGKAIGALVTGGGFNKLFEIIEIKLRQVFWNLFNASWNIVFFLNIIILGLYHKFKKEDLAEIQRSYPMIFKGFKIILVAAIFIFLFNDTGTIAAALILSFLTAPLGLLLNKKQN